MEWFLPMPTLPVSDLNDILARAEPLLERMAGERVFITGGTGFFGRWLLEALTWANDRLDLDLCISVLSRSPDVSTQQAGRLTIHPTITWHRGDVRNFAGPTGQFSFLIHLATAASEQLNRSQPLEMYDTITVGTRRVLEFAEHAGCRAMLLASSGAVYGPQPPQLDRVTETYGGGPDPNSPLSAYSEGKRVAEFICSVSTVPVKIARCFAFLGPHLPLDTHFAAGNFIRDAALGRPILVRGDGTAYRSYLYAADLVIWLLTILLEGKANRPYNVGSDMPISIADLARLVASAGGAGRVEIQGLASGQPAGRYVPAIDRARDELGLDVWTSLDEAVERTLRWVRRSGLSAPAVCVDMSSEKS